MMYQCPRCYEIKSDGSFVITKIVCSQCSNELNDTAIIEMSRIEKLMKNAPSDVQEIISEKLNEVV